MSSRGGSADVGIILGLFAPEARTPLGGGPMTRDAIAAIFDRRRAAYDNQDAVTLAADYAIDCVIESPSGGIHHGREAAEQVLKSVFDALDVKMHQDVLLIDGDLVAQI